MLAATVATMLAASAAPASHDRVSGDQGPVVLAPTAVATAGSSYLPGTVVVREGEEMRFLNADAMRHSVTSTTSDGDGMPLFDSGALGLAGQAFVAGVSSLKARVQGYAFSCVIHPWMQGTVIVFEGSIQGEGSQ